jgi:hypothetical protein
MKIRPEQMAALGADRLDELVATATLKITTRYPEVAYRRTAAALDTLVRDYIAEAARFGIDSERGALRYIEYRIEFREGLLHAPQWAWARDILTDPNLDEAGKLARIDHLAYGAPLPDDGS